jgi:branched-chain amino acid transport system ATP-binding protein
MLKVENLDLYYGDAQALSGVSLEVPQGEIVAIVGANGAGKSSLIRTIAGIEKARAGRIRFKGADITRLASHRICDLGIGQVAEGRQVFPSLSVEENLQMGALLPRARAGAAQALDEVYAMFPRLAERRVQLAGTLSGGEQQMLAIGRALMARPRLLMLDEPSMGLAPLVVKDIFATVARVSREAGTTVLLVEQNARGALRVADRGYVLETGRIVLEGSAEELLANRDVQRAYLGGDVEMERRKVRT